MNMSSHLPNNQVLIAQDELSELRDTKELLIRQKRLLQNTLDKVNQKLEQIVSTNKDQLNLLYSQKIALKRELEIQEKNQKDERERHTELLDNCKQKLIQQEVRISIMNQETRILKKELGTLNDRNAHLQLQFGKLSSSTLELANELDDVLEERNALLCRCSGLESECENIYVSNSQVRSEFDGSVCALHELARENQSLKIELYKKSNRKWIKDSSVTNCTNCSKRFTLTLRKHHCRNCGLIFCKDCSTKSAQVPSSKYPVRVCEKCYIELSK